MNRVHRPPDHFSPVFLVDLFPVLLTLKPDVICFAPSKSLLPLIAIQDLISQAMVSYTLAYRLSSGLHKSVA